MLVAARGFPVVSRAEKTRFPENAVIRPLVRMPDFQAYLGHLATSDAYMVYRCDFGLSLDY